MNGKSSTFTGPYQIGNIGFLSDRVSALKIIERSKINNIITHDLVA
jgi:hypothetical protein